MTIVTDTTSTVASDGPAVPTKVAGEVIDAASFRQMVDILDSLVNHQHTFSDDYTANCQCNCNRGNL